MPKGAFQASAFQQDAFQTGEFVTGTDRIQLPVNCVMAGQQIVPSSTNGVSRALLRSIFRE